MSTDGRRRYNRRRKAIEAALRRELERQGRMVDLLMEHRIAAAAEACVQVEIIRAKLELGEEVHPEVHSRWLNAMDRLLTRIGIKPAFMAPPAPKPVKPLSVMLRELRGMT